MLWVCGFTSSVLPMMWESAKNHGLLMDIRENMMDSWWISATNNGLMMEIHKK